jgi:hypothetical protein
MAGRLRAAVGLNNCLPCSEVFGDRITGKLSTRVPPVMLFAAHLFIENKSETTFVIPTAQALSNRVPAEYGFRQPRPALFLWYVRYP